jgi:hypothetical protein
MSTVQVERFTVADLLEQLGGISPERVRLQPAPGMATEQDVLDIYAREKRPCELVDGVLVEKPMGYYESRLGLLITQRYSRLKQLGGKGLMELMGRRPF